MRTREDIQAGIARFITEMRLKKGLSKTKFAELIEVDKHTLMRWESGACAPSVTDLVQLYDKLGESMIRLMLDTVYPPEPAMDHEDEAIDQIRKDAAEYILEKAPDHIVRVIRYLVSGQHGSEFEPQIEEFCAINHLPMHYRFFVAQDVYVYYMMALKHHELVHTNRVMPDMDVFANGLKRAQKAAFDRLQSYTEDNHAKL